MIRKERSSELWRYSDAVLSERELPPCKWDTQGDLNERLMCEQTSEGSVASILHIKGENSLGRGNCKCKRPYGKRGFYVLEKGRRTVSLKWRE